jgi:hypothetical protein
LGGFKINKNTKKKKHFFSEKEAVFRGKRSKTVRGVSKLREKKQLLF